MATHTGEKPYHCNECNKSYSSIVQLNSHKKDVHLGIRPFECQQCDKYFVSQSKLNNHLMIHTGNGDSVFVEKSFNFIWYNFNEI